MDLNVHDSGGEAAALRRAADALGVTPDDYARELGAITPEDPFVAAALVVFAELRPQFADADALVDRRPAA